MKKIKLEGTFQQSLLEAREQFESLLKDFDEFVLKVDGSQAIQSANQFRSLLKAQTEGLIRHLKILDAIFSISSLFSSHSNLNEVLSLIVEGVKEVLNFGRVIILLLNSDRSLLECKVLAGMTSENMKRALSKPFIMDKHDCIETRVARYGESYLIKDIDDPRLTDIDRRVITRMERGATIFVPITSKNGIIGVFGVDRQSPQPPVQPEDIGSIQLFANYIGVLIENAKLYESILEHKNYFENIIQQFPNGIIIIALSGEIKLINKAGERLLGIHKSGFLARPIERLLGTAIAERLRHALLNQDRAQLYDISFERSDKKSLILNLSCLKVKSENISEVVIMFQDMTDKKMIDQHLQRLDKLATIGTMAAGIAHEIRSPLTSISMDLDTLYESAFETEKVQQTIIDVLNEIERTDKIISNLLQFSRHSGKDFVRFEFSNLMDETILLAKKKVGKKRIHFRRDPSSTPQEIIGNPDRLKQMAVNLLVNAVEAIEADGVITTAAGFLDEENEYMSRALKNRFFKKHKSVFRICIKDTGAGIPLEFKEKVFDPYFTTKGYGTGLGLAVVSKIVEEHQGYVSVSSEPGQGSMFEVFLPADTLAD